MKIAKTKRVCFSTAIAGCGRAINADSWHQYYVYVPANYNGDIIKPTKKKVPDVCVTREKWFMNKTRVKCIGKVYFYRSNQWHMSDNYIYYSDYRLRFRWLEKY